MSDTKRNRKTDGKETKKQHKQTGKESRSGRGCCGAWLLSYALDVECAGQKCPEGLEVSDRDRCNGRVDMSWIPETSLLKNAPSALPLLLLVHGRRSKEVSTIRHALASAARGSQRHRRHRAIGLDEALLTALDRHAHVAPVSAFATVTLVFADAAFDAYAGVLAAATGSLAIAALLALAASLAARLGGEVFLVGAEGVLEVDGGRSGGLARLRR